MNFNIIFVPSFIGHTAVIGKTALVNLSSIRRDLKRRQSQRNTDTPALKQYVWQCEILMKICENLENLNEVCLNTVFWYVQSSNVEVFKMCDMQAQTIYKIIAPDLEYWYIECYRLTFAGVQKRPDINSNQPSRPYYHSVQDCAINDLPCSKWKSCSGPCEDDGALDTDETAGTKEIGLLYDEQRLRIRMNNGIYSVMAPIRPNPTPKILPEDFDEMPTLMYNEIADNLEI